MAAILLHGSDTIGNFVLRLKAISDENYGVVGRRFVLRILRELAEDSGALASWLEARRNYFIRLGRKNVSDDSRHERVISHFATVYAGLRLANRYGLLRLPRDGTRDALFGCLRDHLVVTAGAMDRLVAHSPLSLLQAYVRKNRDNFVNLDGARLPKGHNRATCPGYIYQAAGRTWFAFPNALVERVVGSRGALSALRRELGSLKLIKKAGGGQDGDRFATKVKVGSRRVYLLSVDSSVFD
jgi:hypothetical protein